jgi:hypothetical protein
LVEYLKMELDEPSRWASQLRLGFALEVSMAHAVHPRAASGSLIQAWWFRFLVRAALVLLAFGALWFAEDRFHALLVQESAPSSNLSFDNSLWLLSVGAAVATGLLFGLAAWLPFTRIRYLPSRLMLAAVALVPVAHFWWTVLERHARPTGWLWRAYWFDLSVEVQFVLAALAGVAIASGFRARSRPRSTWTTG